ncbi:MAG: c-type cytochrome [Pararhizobium sp.]
MNSSYLNMAAGAFLGTCFVAMTLSIVSGAIYSSPNPEKPGFAIKAAEAPAAGAGQPAKAEVPPIAPLLAKADAKQGEQIFKKCQACHDGTKGGPNKIGPNLWGVVGRPIASHPGFSYSSALKSFSEGGKKQWTYDLLNHWVHDPHELVSGTSMTFPGIKKDQERADVIAYLHTLSDNPVPFPKPDEGKTAGGDKGADAGKDGAAASGGAPAKNAAPAATGEQSSKPSTAAPSDTAPAGNDANAGSQSNTQSATEQNPASQGSNQPSQPATQAPAAGSTAPAQ